jgi:DNA modification methylase
MTEPMDIGDCRLYCGDALEVMATLPAASFDTVITDPPYCSGAATEAGRGSSTHQGLRSEAIRGGRFDWFDADNMTTSGLVWLLRAVAVQADRLLTPAGSLCIFCDWRMAFTLGPALESAGFRLRNLIVWDKGSFGCGTGFRPQHELVLHLTRRAPEFHTADVGNVIQARRVPSQEREHPTEKPIALLQELIRVTCPPAGRVLDPFLGSGATLVAAVAIGRSGVGIEKNAGHVETAARRIGEASHRTGLFGQSDLFNGDAA